MTGHKTKAGKTALEGKKTLAHMLRLIKRGETMHDLSVRYSRAPGVIIAYLRERGYDTNGKPLPKALVPTRPLVLSAGGTAQYVAASNHDAASIPTRPVAYRNARPVPTGLDWAAISPDTKCNCETLPHTPACPAWVPDDVLERRRYARTISRRKPRSSNSGTSGPAPKFTPKQDTEIRAKYDAGATAKALAKEYGAADVTIARAIQRAGGTTGGRSGRWRWQRRNEERAAQTRQDHQEAS